MPYLGRANLGVLVPALLVDSLLPGQAVDQPVVVQLTACLHEEKGTIIV